MASIAAAFKKVEESTEKVQKSDKVFSVESMPWCFRRVAIWTLFEFDDSKCLEAWNAILSEDVQQKLYASSDEMKGLVGDLFEKFVTYIFETVANGKLSAPGAKSKLQPVVQALNEKGHLNDESENATYFANLKMSLWPTSALQSELTDCLNYISSHASKWKSLEVLTTWDECKPLMAEISDLVESKKADTTNDELLTKLVGKTKTCSDKSVFPAKPSDFDVTETKFASARSSWESLLTDMVSYYTKGSDGFKKAASDRVVEIVASNVDFVHCGIACIETHNEATASKLRSKLEAIKAQFESGNFADAANADQDGHNALVFELQENLDSASNLSSWLDIGWNAIQLVDKSKRGSSWEDCIRVATVTSAIAAVATCVLVWLCSWKTYSEETCEQTLSNIRDAVQHAEKCIRIATAPLENKEMLFSIIADGPQKWVKSVTEGRCEAQVQSFEGKLYCMEFAPDSTHLEPVSDSREEFDKASKRKWITQSQTDRVVMMAQIMEQFHDVEKLQSMAAYDSMSEAYVRFRTSVSQLPSITEIDLEADLTFEKSVVDAVDDLRTRNDKMQQLVKNIRSAHEKMTKQGATPPSMVWTHSHKVHLLYRDPPGSSSTLLDPPELSRNSI